MRLRAAGRRGPRGSLGARALRACTACAAVLWTTAGCGRVLQTQPAPETRIAWVNAAAAQHNGAALGIGRHPPAARAVSPPHVLQVAARSEVTARGATLTASADVLPSAATEAPAAAEEGADEGINWQAAWVFVGTYIAYASCYLARNNAAVAKAPLLALPALNLLDAPISPTAALGVLDAGFLIAYALGCFVVPAVLDLDRRKPWDVVWSAIAVAGLSQLGLCAAWVFLLGHGLGPVEMAVALVCCMVNGLAQSVLYPTCKKLMADSFGSNGAVLGIWNTCYYLGGVASTLIAAGLCDNLGWPVAFLGPGVLLLLVAAAGTAAVGAAVAGSGAGEAAAASKEAPAAEAQGADTGLGERLSQLLRPPSSDVCVVAGQYFAVKLIRYVFGLWLPLLLAASHGGWSGSGLLQVGATAAIFDVGSIIGSLVLGAQAEYLGKQALPLLVFASTAALYLLLPALPAAMAGGCPDGALFGSAWSMLLAVGVATGGAETLLGSICPIHYAQRNQTSVSSAVASVNGYGSLGTVASALVLPLLAGSGSGAADLANGFASLAPLAGMAALAAIWQGCAGSRD